MDKNQVDVQELYNLKLAISESIKKQRDEKRKIVSFYIQNIGIIGSLTISITALAVSIFALLKK